jgi:hypothetical protein
MVNNEIAGSHTGGIGIGKIESNGWADINEELGRLSWYGSYSSSFTTGIGAYISAACDANWNGNETPSRLTFATAPENSATPVERMRIDKDGDLFLGMTSGHHEAADRTVFEMSGTNTALIGFDIGGSYSTYMYDSGQSGALEINHPASVYLNADTNLRFATGSNVEAMRIDSSGNVGIGTNDPQAMLEVHGPIVFGDVNTDDASGITDTYNNVSVVGAGDIILNTGVALSNDSSTCTITWAKPSWAALNYDIEYSVASAAGRVAGGGYHNGSGATISGHQEAVLYGSDYLTIGGSGQTLIFIITFPGNHHPHVRARFSSSGGAGSPNAGDFTVAWTNT